MTELSDPLERFVTAQEGTWQRALAELRAGRKTTHWMWYIFPQLRGLGRSERARFFGIVSLDEARAYLAHPVLGPRLRECTAAVMALTGLTLIDIFGGIDAAKFRSCMTLFARAASDPALFQSALDKYCGGQPDRMTLDLLA